MSRLEEFINQNRDAFDDENPSKKVWEKVELHIPVKEGRLKKINAFTRWSIAASLLLVVISAVILMTRKPTPSSTVASNTNPDTSTSEIAAVLSDAAPEMSQFAKLIALKQEELKLLSREQPELYQKFSTDINQLDSSYRSLKNQLSRTPNKEILIEAMVQNLQLQLNVLNQQLNIINQIKQSKKYSHEKNKNFT